jgi:DNA-binding transcriptional ArsR family regulator
MGPIDVAWVRQAAQLGVTALLVGLALWYLKGLRGSNTFIVSNLMMGEWGIQPDAKSRALRKLEKAGLINIERRGKRSPLVSLVLNLNVAADTPVTTAIAGFEAVGQGRARPL